MTIATDGCHRTLIYKMQTRSTSNSPTNETPGPARTTRGRKAAVLKIAKDPGGAAKCQWSLDEEKRLIEFLVSRKSEVGDGGNFKQPTWTAATLEMAKVPTKGPNKTATACSSKYGRVCILSDNHTICLNIVQLCLQYNHITTLKGLSGLGSRYTVELGMNIGVAEQSVWMDYTTVCFF